MLTKMLNALLSKSVVKELFFFIKKIMFSPFFSPERKISFDIKKKLIILLITILNFFVLKVNKTAIFQVKKKYIYILSFLMPEKRVKNHYENPISKKFQNKKLNKF